MPDRREDTEPKGPGHRDRRGLIITLLVVALLVPVGITTWNSIQSEKPAPDFTLVDTGYENGVDRGPESFSLSDFQGKTVVIDFMAYNCPSCRRVTPALEDLHDDLNTTLGDGADDVVFLTIDVGDFTSFPGSSTENLIKWQTEDFHSPWRHALDTSGVFLDYIDACLGGIPCLFIVGSDGGFLFQNTGVPSTDRMLQIITDDHAGDAEAISVVSVGVLGVAFLAGLTSFFAPCSVGLIPAYMGFLLQGQAQGAGRGRTLGAGLLTAAGIVSLYAVLAVVLWAFQDSLASIIPRLGPIVGGILVLLGIFLLIGFDWDRVARLFGMGKVDGRKGFYAFGIGYGLAAFGCTGPVFLPVLVLGFAQSTLMGLLAFVVYTVAVASLVVFAAFLVGAGQQTRLRALLSHTKTITRISAILLIGAGAYLLWFDLAA